MILDSDSGCRTNSRNYGRSSSAVDGSGEIMLFGVRVKVDPMRKSVSMNDLSQYVHLQPDSTRDSSSNTNHLDGSAAVAADAGYASADDAVRKSSIAGRARKRGVPWTEDEHKLFLLGLEKVGKGDWRGISRNYVKTRTPTQVASHAQKYFLRRSNLNRRRRRSSLFDITTDSVASIPAQEEQVHEDSSGQSAQPPILSIENQTEHTTFDTRDQIKTGPTGLTGPTPVPLFPTPNLSTMADTYSNPKQQRDSLSLSLTLNLSLTFDHNNQTDSSAFQAFSGFKNREGIITVV